MKRRIGICLLALLGVCVVVLIASFVVLSRPPPPTPTPNPNGYDDFVQAGKVAVISASFYDATNREQLRAVISTNAETLRLLRVGLSRECRFPLDRFLTNAGGHLQTLASMKFLAQLLHADGRLAELDGRTNDAVASYLDAIKLGSAIGRGGLVIDSLVTIACESIGLSPLSKLVPALSLDQSRHLMSELEAIEPRLISWDEVWRNEKISLRHQFHRNPTPMWLIETWRLRTSVKQHEQVRENIVRAKVRLVITELALRCYQREKGAPPTRLDQLVPQYVKTVPQDPFNGKPLVYRPQGAGWSLYSVGLDGVDNGGVRTTNRGNPPPGTDLFYDSP